MSTPADKPAQRRSLLGRILLSVVVALVSLELALRLVDLYQGRPAWGSLGNVESSNALYMPHPYIGYVSRPGPKFGVNAQGLRGEPVARRKPEGVFRVVCLGGSTTFCGTEDASRTWPALLEDTLNVHSTGPTYEVLNAGVPGYTSAESLINFQLRMVEYQPDLVLIYHAVNDARIIQVGGFEPDYTHKRTSWKYPAVSPLEKLLLQHCRIFYRVFGEAYFDPAGMRLDQVVFLDGPHPEPAWGEGVNRAGVAVFLRNIRHIVAVAGKSGVRPVLTTFASCPERLPGPAFDNVLASMNQGLTSLARSEGLPLLELASPFRERAELFIDYVHFSAEGCREAAREFYEQGRRAGIWERP